MFGEAVGISTFGAGVYQCAISNINAKTNRINVKGKFILEKLFRIISLYFLLIADRTDSNSNATNSIRLSAYYSRANCSENVTSGGTDNQTSIVPGIVSTALYKYLKEEASSADPNGLVNCTTLFR